MLYTTRFPDRQADRIHLYPSPEAAGVDADDARAVLGVAVRLDRGDRRLIPLWTDPQVFDPAWTTPAELLADGSIIARGPFPDPLFLRALPSASQASTTSPELVPDRVVARSLRVSARMIRLWIDTGAWPLPRAVGATTRYFKSLDVDCWLKTGTWPVGARFRTTLRRPGRGGLRR